MQLFLRKGSGYCTERKAELESTVFSTVEKSSITQGRTSRIMACKIHGAVLVYVEHSAQFCVVHFMLASWRKFSRK